MQVMHTTRSPGKTRSSSLMMNRKPPINAWRKKGSSHHLVFFSLVLIELVCVRRSGSRASSRATTPSTSARRDYDYFDDASNNPYDEYGAYDMNYGAGPSRPPPIPYDDPYSDSFTSIPNDGDGEDSRPFNNIRSPTGRHDSIRSGSMGSVGSVDGSGRGAHMNDRGSEPGPRYRNMRGRGRGGGRNRQPDRGRRGRGKGTPQHPREQWSGSHDHNMTSPSGFGHPYSQQSSYGGIVGDWNYGAPLMTPQTPVFGFGLQDSLPGVQPHINPRFANQLGFNFSQMPQIPQMSPGAGSPPSSEQYHLSDADSRYTTGNHQWEEECG